MKKFIVERILPGAGVLSAEEIGAISQTSCEAINKLGQPYYWMQSFITDDKIYCVHIAESEDAVREHARLAKIPVNTITEIKSVIDPSNWSPND